VSARAWAFRLRCNLDWTLLMTGAPHCVRALSTWCSFTQPGAFTTGESGLLSSSKVCWLGRQATQCDFVYSLGPRRLTGEAGSIHSTWPEPGGSWSVSTLITWLVCLWTGALQHFQPSCPPQPTTWTPTPIAQPTSSRIRFVYRLSCLSSLVGAIRQFTFWLYCSKRH